MQKTIALLVFSTVFLTLFLCACNKKPSEEQTTDNSDKVFTAIDKSTPISQGNLITKTDTDSDGNLNINYYDSKGNLVENFIWDDDEKVSHSVMTYSETNQLIQKENISPDGQSNTVESYKYNNENSVEQKTVSEYEDGKLKKSTMYDADNKCTGYSLSFYNEADLLTKIERYDSADKLIEYFMYEYNDESQNIKYSAYTSDAVLTKYTTFDYNDEGKVSQEKYFDGNNELLSYYTFEYDENGNMTISRSYDSQGNLKSEDFITAE